jgi:rhodanese-related sulfurtransferase
MKKIYKEVLLIIVLSSAFGIVYNLLAEKPIPFFAEKKEVKTVSDSVLFGKGEIKEKYFDKVVGYDQIKKLIGKDDVQFIDARSPEQYAKGHIGNAINLFPQMENQEELLNNVNELPHNKILIVYCDGGNCDLSHELAKILFDFGYKQTFLYRGGWEEWEKRKSEK